MVVAVGFEPTHEREPKHYQGPDRGLKHGCPRTTHEAKGSVLKYPLSACVMPAGFTRSAAVSRCSSYLSFATVVFHITGFVRVPYPGVGER